MRLDFILTLVTLATTSLRTNLKPFAPILNHFGLNSLPPKVLGIDGLDQKEKNLEPKIKTLEKIHVAYHKKQLI